MHVTLGITNHKQVYEDLYKGMMRFATKVSLGARYRLVYVDEETLGEVSVTVNEKVDGDEYRIEFHADMTQFFRVDSDCITAVLRFEQLGEEPIVPSQDWCDDGKYTAMSGYLLVTVTANSGSVRVFFVS